MSFNDKKYADEYINVESENGGHQYGKSSD